MASRCKESYRSDGDRNRTLQRKRDRYSNLTTTDREIYIRNSVEKRQKRCRKDWLLRAKSHVNEAQEIVHSCSELHILKESEICLYCGARKFEYETPTFCCDNGKINLPTTAMPSELHDLFTGETEEAIDFRRNIRVYNSLFNFTSFGATIDKNLASNRKGIYTFKVQGQVYHELPALLPNIATGPRYFQLYFIDTKNEIQNRMKIMEDGSVSESLTQKIKNILDENPYSKILRKLEDAPSLHDAHIHISKDIELDQRVYNCPTADQVAAVWVEGNNSIIPTERHIEVHANSGHKHRINYYNGCYDPLQYPLLFPSGESGWQQNILKVNASSSNVNRVSNIDGASTSSKIMDSFTEQLLNEEAGQEVLPPAGSTSMMEELDDFGTSGFHDKTSKKVSCREYYCYKFQIRPGQQCTLLHAGRLFQQFVVDQYIKLETSRLDFFRRNQKQMRAELYQGIVDSITAGECRGSELGTRIVLPGTFIGGDRDMKRRFLDSLCLVQRFGKPDLFITMTCNPEWIEIKEELRRTKQHYQDRPDLTSRVFRAKLQDLKDQLFQKAIFGEVAAHVHVIEFQKRGLPHAHILIILKSEHKLKSPDQYDKYVCAEIPDEEKNPELYEIIKNQMMHGPCGENNKGCSCMKDGRCKYRYPRDFS